MSEKKQTLFEQLYQLDVNKNVEKKGQLKYLSWVFALAELKKVDENASYEVHEFPYIIGGHVVEGVTVPYLLTEQGAMVKVSVTVKGKTETEWLPVMDHKNQTMMTPKMTDINKSHKRCFAKAAAHHGLGLYIYAGEDLPEDIDEQKLENAKQTIKKLIGTLSGLSGVEEKTIFADYKITANITLDEATRTSSELRKAIQKATAEQEAMKDVEMEVNGNE